MSLLPSSLSGSQRICHRHTRFPPAWVRGVRNLDEINLPHADCQVLRRRGSGEKKAASLPPPQHPYILGPISISASRRLGSLQVRAKDDWRLGVAIFPARSAGRALWVGGASGCELGFGRSVVRVAPRDTVQQK